MIGCRPPSIYVNDLLARSEVRKNTETDSEEKIKKEDAEWKIRNSREYIMYLASKVVIDKTEKEKEKLHSMHWLEARMHDLKLAIKNIPDYYEDAELLKTKAAALIENLKDKRRGRGIIGIDITSEIERRVNARSEVRASV